MEAPTQEDQQPNTSSRAWYGASIAEFLQAQPETVVGHLTANSEFAVLPTQTDAWLAQIDLLKAQLAGLTGSIFFEFNIPRMGRRVDVVLVIGAVVFVVEFKVGENGFERSAVDQAWDYALDLKNFHQASHALAIVPILLATEARVFTPRWSRSASRKSVSRRSTAAGGLTTSRRSWISWCVAAHPIALLRSQLGEAVWAEMRDIMFTYLKEKLTTLPATLTTCVWIGIGRKTA